MVAPEVVRAGLRWARGHRAGAAAASGAGTPAVRVSPGMLLSLMSGRGAWRVAFNISNVVLLAAWGRRAFTDYAAAMGTATLLPMLAGGVEKASLKLVPRAARARSYLIGGYLVMACLLPLPFLAWLVAADLLRRPGIGALQVAVGLFEASLGLNLVLVGLQRALGRPMRDVQSYLALSVTFVLGSLLVALVDLPPAAFATLALVASASIDLWLLRSLGGRLRGLLRRRRLLRLMGGTMVMMGGHDLALGASISAVFALLAASSLRGQSAQLFLVLSAWSILSAGFTYVLRVFQPQVALALDAGGGTVGRARARRLARLVLGGWAVYLSLGLLGTLLVVGGLAPSPLRLPLIVVLAAILLARVPLFLLNGSAVYLLENADTRSLRLVAVAAAGGLLGVVTLALLLVPRLGAVGALLALASYDAFQSAVLLIGGRRPRAGGPARSRSAA
jgi:hypothetical protein